VLNIEELPTKIIISFRNRPKGTDRMLQISKAMPQTDHISGRMIQKRGTVF